MHGKDTSPNEKWYPWFLEQVKELGLDCFAPYLPEADNPKIKDWISKLEELHPDSETILVGHSRGGVAILRWLEVQQPELKVKKVILIATNSGFLKENSLKNETNYGFYTDSGYDFSKIKQHCSEFVVLHSKDDKWVPFEAGLENAQGLGAKFLSFEDRGHFGKGVDQIPELIKEISG